MNTINKRISYMRHPKSLLNVFIFNNSKYLSDKLYLTLRWWCLMGYKLNWEHPKTFCEKLQWLKLYNRNPEYTIMTDKIRVKEWVAKRIGKEYIIPTLGTWERAEDIDFDTLPNQFVLKCNHNSGIGTYICRDKSKLKKNEVISGLKRGLEEDYYLRDREWPYRDIHRQILAEEYMENKDDGTACLTDYKFYCFNGEPLYCQVIKDRSTKETIDFFDMEWQHQEFIGLNPSLTHAATCPKKPQQFEKMKLIAKTLAIGIPFVRVDLYEINGRVYFGEITFFPACGLGRFVPDYYNNY